MPTLSELLAKAIQGRNPLIYLWSSEEDRVTRVIREVAGDSIPVHAWSCTAGFEGRDGGDSDRDPVTALQTVLAEKEPAYFILKDLAAFMDQPRVIRSLRELYYDAGTEAIGRFVFILTPELVIPEGLKKELHLVDVSPPHEDEIGAEIARIGSLYPGVSLPADHYDDVMLALKGLTLSEIGHILHRVLQVKTNDKAAMLDEIFDEKERIVKKSGYLEFVPPRWDIQHIGGLQHLKDWLTKRQGIFSREALAAGVPMPKGLLVMGVSGCGKSLAVKVISALWHVPLFRLDMNLVFSGMYGSPEEAFHKALKQVEAVAPAILWIDEIENSLGLEENALRIDSHIFSAFLTWMQEKSPLVFIAATANRINALPAEIIRKGRFDQIFFVDLPSDTERRQIIRIHLELNGGDPKDFDMELLTVMTEGWNGAEIEQAVVGARVDAFYEKPIEPATLIEVVERLLKERA